MLYFSGESFSNVISLVELKLDEPNVIFVRLVHNIIVLIRDGFL